jgi:hypothetical protein
VDLIAEEHPRAVRLGLGLLRAGGAYLASHIGSLSRETSAEHAQGQHERQPPFDFDDFEVARFGDRLDSLIIVRRAARTRPRRRSSSKIR